jgi:hypothetical protein
MQKSVDFIHTNNELADTEISKFRAIHKIALKIKYLGINLTMEVKESRDIPKGM